ncbi:HAD family hydrolase [Paenibacillus sp. GSMTC-2017]|uniref:HAD family hydrolase n=1 Tax=Paenibacillus sp. GSMTC-2017 TaxID=2794350 RepID=UPI001A2CBD79|nr:HAD family hydrolase [Paenibacillus sp. GSMTC-2017]
MKCVLLDLDGTLQDSESLATEAVKVGFRSILNREATNDELAYLKGKPIAKVIVLLLPEEGALIYEKAAQHYILQSGSIALYDGVLEMLEQLSRDGFELGIVSSKTRANVRKELESNGIIHYFTCIVGQEDTKEHKPSPVPLLLAASQMGYNAEDCFYIGDQPTDIIAASAAGMGSGAALWGEGELGILSKTNPDVLRK